MPRTPTPERFENIYRRACDRHGGAAAVTSQLPRVRSSRALARTHDDRWLAQMTR